MGCLVSGFFAKQLHFHELLIAGGIISFVVILTLVFTTPLFEEAPKGMCKIVCIILLLIGTAAFPRGSSSRSPILLHPYITPLPPPLEEVDK